MPDIATPCRGLWRELSSGGLLAALGVALGLMAWAIVVGSGVMPAPSTGSDGPPADLTLYRAISERVADGESYYHAAVAEQAASGFPVAPAPTVRLPTLAWLNASLSSGVTYGVLLGLGSAVFVGALLRFERVAPNRITWVAMMLLLALGMLQVAAPPSTYYAESWAFALITLSLLVGIERRPLASWTLAGAALAFREHAGLAVVAIAIWLWVNGRRRLALAWLALLALFAVMYMTLHAPHVAEAVAAQGLDPADAGPGGGWLDFGGWPRTVDYVRSTTPLAALPYAAAAVIVPLALVGWLLRRDRWASRTWAVLTAYCLAFMIVGRANNLYWGLLFAPLLLPGLALVPSGVRACLAPAGRRQVTGRRSAP